MCNLQLTDTSLLEKVHSEAAAGEAPGVKEIEIAHPPVRMVCFSPDAAHLPRAKKGDIIRLHRATVGRAGRAGRRGASVRTGPRGQPPAPASRAQRRRARLR